MPPRTGLMTLIEGSMTLWESSMITRIVIDPSRGGIDAPKRVIDASL